MTIAIKRVDQTLPLPEYKTHGAAAFDVYARTETTIPAGGWGLVPTNLIIATPENYALILSARSSLPKHYPGLILANGIGVIDSDYRGDDDEICVSLYNISDTAVTITRGDRIAQGRFVPFTRADWQEVTHMENTNRGGFGSTGV
jgi:dUTP pyrophosphatase